MFKMDVNTGEAKFIKTDSYKELDPIIKIDILKDWIESLIEEHQKNLDIVFKK